MSTRPRIVAFVPIKRESERLPNKNFLLLGGLPLYGHILRTLTATPAIDDVYLFTSAPRGLFELPKGVQYLQKDEQNNRPMGIIREFCMKVASDLYVLAHATTPFTRRETLEHAIAEVSTGRHDSALPVERINTFAWCGARPVNYDPNSVPKTQEIEPVLIETSGFYLFERSLALKDSRRVGYRPLFCEVSFPETIDIDYLWQFNLAELHIQHSSECDGTSDEGQLGKQDGGRAR